LSEFPSGGRMRRSEKIVAGAVIAAILICWLLFDRQGGQPDSSASEEAHFVGIRQASDNRTPVSPSPHEAQTQAEAERGLPGRSARPFPVKQRGPSDNSMPARLDITVLDGATRQLVKDVKVTAVNRATGDTVTEQQLPEGRGTIQLPTAALRLSIEHPDYRERGLWLEFSSGGVQSSQQVVELVRQVRLTGVVRDQNGRVVSGATIRFPGSTRDRPIMTGFDGKFECTVGPGRLEGAITKGADTTGFQADITPYTRTLNLILPVTWASVTFSGRVLNEKSEPAEGAKVTVKTLVAEGPPPASGDSLTVQDDGTFALSTVPLSSAQVRIQLDGYQTIEETVSLTGDLHREYSLEPYNGFSVTLVTPEGELLTKGFRVTGVGSSISKIHRFPDGRYHATDYPVEIQATATELGYGNSEVVSLASYEPEVMLKMEPGGTVRGRVLDENGLPVRRFSFLLLQGPKLYLSQSLIDSAEGAFCVRHVAPGRYTLKIVAGSGVEQREIDVVVSRECLVDFVMKPTS